MRISVCSNCSTKYPYFLLAVGCSCKRCGKLGNLTEVPVRRFNFRTDADLVISVFSESRTWTRRKLYPRVAYRIDTSAKFNAALSAVIEPGWVLSRDTRRKQGRWTFEYELTDSGIERLIQIVEEGAPDANREPVYVPPVERVDIEFESLSELTKWTEGRRLFAEPDRALTLGDFKHLDEGLSDVESTTTEEQG